jgi:hypothetical protein
MKEKKFFNLLNIALILYLLLVFWFFFTYNKPIEKSEKIELVIKGVFLLISCIVIVSIVFFRKALYKKRKDLALLIVILFFCVLMAEIGLRVVFSKRMPMYSPHPYLNYYGTPNYISKDGQNIHNSLGYRGKEIVQPKPTKTFRIVITGSSTTYESLIRNWTKDFARTVEKNLQELYDYKEIEVVNAGLGGWTTWESLINLEFRVFDLSPDLIIIYEGGTDVHARLVPPSVYSGDNTGMMKQWERKPCVSFFCSRLLATMDMVMRDPLDVHTETWAVTENPGYNDILGMTPMEAIKENRPVYFERNIRNMVAICEENNVPVLLSTFAHSTEFKDYSNTEYYDYAYKQENDIIKEIGKEHNVPVFDFEKEMPSDKKYWYDGRHVNEIGSEVKGKLFANFIYSQKLIDEKIKVLKNGKK